MAVGDGTSLAFCGTCNSHDGGSDFDIVAAVREKIGYCIDCGRMIDDRNVADRAEFAIREQGETRGGSTDIAEQDRFFHGRTFLDETNLGPASAARGSDEADLINRAYQ